MRPLLAVALLLTGQPLLAVAQDEPLPKGALVRLGNPRWRLQGEPRRILVSPDGQRIAVVTKEGSVEFVDVKTARSDWVGGRNGLTSFLLDVRMSAAVARSLGKVALADIDLKAEQATFTILETRDREIKQRALAWQKDGDDESPEGVIAAAFSPDEKILATATACDFKAGKNGAAESLRWSCLVRTWDVATGKKLCELPIIKTKVKQLIFFPDGKNLLTASTNGEVRIWDPRAGKERGQSWQAGRPLHCAEFSPDGNWLAVGSKNGVSVIDARNGKSWKHLEIADSDVNAVAFSPNGKLLAAAGKKLIRLWSWPGAMNAGDLAPLERAAEAVAFSHDGAILYSGHIDETTIRRWDVKTKEPIPERRGHAACPHAMAFSADSRFLVSDSNANDAVRWDVVAGMGVDLHPDDCKQVCLECVGSNSRHICGKDSMVVAFEQLMKGINPLQGCRLERIPGGSGWSSRGQRMLFLDDVRLLVTDALSGKQLLKLTWKDKPILAAAISPDGKEIVSAGTGWLSFREISTGKDRAVSVPSDLLTLHPIGMKFTRDGSRIAIMGSTGDFITLNRSDGRCLSRKKLAAKHVADFCLSPDEQTVATVAESVALWEAATGQGIRSVPVGTTLFSPDNRLVANLSDDLRVLDIYNGENAARVAQKGLLDNFVFSADGKRLATAHTDSTILVWNTERPNKPGKRLSAAQLETLWLDLQKGKADSAYRSIGVLWSDPESSVSFLQKRLEPIAPAPAEQLNRLIANLGRDDFAEREKSTKELTRLGRRAEEVMRTAVPKSSPEARARLQRILAELPKMQLGDEELGHVRAIQALERIGTPAARRVLAALATGDHAAPRTCAARGALGRPQR